MGRKKKRADKVFCYYCDREFDDEMILVEHQKAKHFRCPDCHKKLYSASGMLNHRLQVHNRIITKVPNANPERDSIEIQIFGMQGIPSEVLTAHYGKDHDASAKQAKVEKPGASGSAFPPPQPYFAIPLSYNPALAMQPPVWPVPPQPQPLSPQMTAVPAPLVPPIQNVTALDPAYINPHLYASGPDIERHSIGPLPVISNHALAAKSSATEIRVWDDDYMSMEERRLCLAKYQCRMKLARVPNANLDRDSLEIKNFGMQGIPSEVLAAHYGKDHDSSAKQGKVEKPGSSGSAFPPPQPYCTIPLSYNPALAMQPPVWPVPPQPQPLSPLMTAVPAPLVPPIQNVTTPYPAYINPHLHASGPDIERHSIGPLPVISNQALAAKSSATEIRVWDDDYMSVEERRLCLAKYQCRKKQPW